MQGASSWAAMHISVKWGRSVGLLRAVLGFHCSRRVHMYKDSRQSLEVSTDLILGKNEPIEQQFVHVLVFMNSAKHLSVNCPIHIIDENVLHCVLHSMSIPDTKS